MIETGLPRSKRSFKSSLQQQTEELQKLGFQRWVTKDGHKIPYQQLTWMEKIHRARGPWCTLAEEQQWEIR